MTICPRFVHVNIILWTKIAETLMYQGKSTWTDLWT